MQQDGVERVMKTAAGVWIYSNTDRSFLKRNYFVGIMTKS